MPFQFVTVNYNNTSFTELFLRSLSGVLREDDRVVVVDNNSAKTELDALRVLIRSFVRETSHDVILVENDKNLGYFGGLNQGLGQCDTQTPTFVGNNDLVFDPDFLLEFDKLRFGEQVSVVAPNIVEKSGRRNNPHIRTKPGRRKILYFDIIFSSYVAFKSFMFLRKWLRRDQAGVSEPVERQRIWSGFGGGYILLPRFFDRLHQLPQDSFLWGEEVLLSRDVIQAGQEIEYVPNLRITHEGGAATGKVDLRRRYARSKAAYKLNRHTMMSVDYEER